MYRYIITESNPAVSLDPLDADSTENYPVANMIYSTPLQITLNDELGSSVLKHFSYDEKKHEISFTLKSGLKFSDGTPISIEDLKFSILRMALARPKFPVIRNISGLEEWLKHPSPLRDRPKGISLQGDTLKILFTKQMRHPLYRFAMEIFSIIPSNCVDKDSNKLLKTPPSSGLYEIKTRSQSAWTFQRRNNPNLIGADVAPEQIEFFYVSHRDIHDFEHKIDDNTVVATREGILPFDQLKYIQDRFETKFLPASRFSLFLLNPRFKPFDKLSCRKVFVHSWYQALKELSSEIPHLEASLFTKILPGYLSLKELEQSEEITITANDRAECVRELKIHPLQWHVTAGYRQPIFEVLLKKTLTNLGLPYQEPKVVNSNAEIHKSFSEDKLGFMFASSGFWPLDPVGDLQMFFTPNLHLGLNRVTENERLQDLIEIAQDSKVGLDRALKDVNYQLFRESKLNVFMHMRRFYFAKKGNSLKELPVSMSTPAPWQVFLRP